MKALYFIAAIFAILSLTACAFDPETDAMEPSDIPGPNAVTIRLPRAFQAFFPEVYGRNRDHGNFGLDSRESGPQELSPYDIARAMRNLREKLYREAEYMRRYMDIVRDARKEFDSPSHDGKAFEDDAEVRAIWLKRYRMPGGFEMDVIPADASPRARDYLEKYITPALRDIAEDEREVLERADRLDKRLKEAKDADKERPELSKDDKKVLKERDEVKFEETNQIRRAIDTEEKEKKKKAEDAEGGKDKDLVEMKKEDEKLKERELKERKQEKERKRLEEEKELKEKQEKPENEREEDETFMVEPSSTDAVERFYRRVPEAAPISVPRQWRNRHLDKDGRPLRRGEYDNNLDRANRDDVDLDDADVDEDNRAERTDSANERERLANGRNYYTWLRDRRSRR